MKTEHFPGQTYLVGLAYQAGKFMCGFFGAGVECEWKPDTTPLTEADKIINRMVIDELQRDYPHITVIGEEESRIVEGSEYVVLVDPIDGTIPFCHNIAASTFCISVLKNGVPIVAVIHDPYCNRTWFAEKGRGTMLNGEPVGVSDQTTLAKSTVSLIWWGGSIGNLDRVCRELMDEKAKWLNLCSVAITAGLIASGNLVASIFPGQNALETAAMQLIVEEAGGIATDLYGNKLAYNADLEIKGHLISNNGHIHERLLGIIARANHPWLPGGAIENSNPTLATASVGVFLFQFGKIVSSKCMESFGWFFFVRISAL